MKSEATKTPKPEKKPKVPRTRSQVGKGSRQKGASFERTIGKIFREWAKPALREGEDPQDWFCRTPSSGGRSWSKKHAQGEDLMVPPWFPFDIEARKRETWSWSALMSGNIGAGQILHFFFEAEKKARGRPVLLVFSKNHESVWTLLDWNLVGTSTGHRIRVDSPKGVRYLSLDTLCSLLKSSDPLLLRDQKDPKQEFLDRLGRDHRFEVGEGF